MNGSQYVLQCLEKEGVDRVFGYPGGAVIPLFDALYDNENIKLYRPNHEQGGTHAADGYARATGKVGVMIVTSGPGITNAVTGIANAYLDSIPMVIIAGQVGKHLLGKSSFQEVDTTGMTMPISKHNFLVTDATMIGDALANAFHIAQSGRPGPVVVDITKNALQEMVEDTSYTTIPKALDLRHESPDAESVIENAIAALRKAKRPVIYAGGGVIKSNSSAKLAELAEKANIPVVNSIMGLSSFDRRSPLSYGIVGMHGDRETNLLVYDADVILGVGVRFSDRAIGHRHGFSPNATVIHLDVDSTEFDKNLDIQYGILGDFNKILQRFIDGLEGVRFTDRFFKNEARELENGFLPTVILDTLQRNMPEDTILVTDVGQHQMWAVRAWKFHKPRTLVTSGGLGTMGFGLGAAIGAKVGRPEANVVLITGDGSFRMNQFELLMARRYDLPLTVVVFNNNTLGMVRQWQALFNEKRYSDTDIYDTLNYEKLCDAYGIHYGGSFKTGTELEGLMADLDLQKGINVLEFQLDHNIAAIPMVAAGSGINEVIDSIE